MLCSHKIFLKQKVGKLKINQLKNHSDSVKLKEELMRSKSLAVSIVVFVLVCFLLTGCGVKDKPMPFNQDKCNKFVNLLNKETGKLKSVHNQDKAMEVLKIYKNITEGKMGYSLDKTLRQVLLFPDESGQGLKVMSIAVSVIQQNPKKALDEGFISKRTYDAFNIAKEVKYNPLNKKSEEFIGFVSECQKQTGNVCNANALLKVLKSKNIMPENVFNDKQPGGSKMAMDVWLGKEYNVPSLKDYIVNPDGSRGNTNGLMQGSIKEFVVNSKQMELSKQFIKITAEEKIELSK